MRINIKRSLIFLLMMTFVTVSYTVLVTLVAEFLWPDKAHGLILTDAGERTIGSCLIGQEFTSPKYFHGRPSSVSWDAGASGASNFAPSDSRLAEVVKSRAAALGGSEILNLPADLLLASGSGLDPHISREAAEFQVERVASERGMEKEDLLAIMARHVEPLAWQVFGRERVNVLLLNADLDKIEFKRDAEDIQ